MARRKVRPGPLEDRSAAILRAIIEEYVATAQPVGSVSLVDKYALAISPATVRNIMAELETAELLGHPHTSAGRVPTDRGYRRYVEALMPKVPVRREVPSEIEISRMRREVDAAMLRRGVDPAEFPNPLVVSAEMRAAARSVMGQGSPFEQLRRLQQFLFDEDRFTFVYDARSTLTARARPSRPPTAAGSGRGRSLKFASSATPRPRRT